MLVMSATREGACKLEITREQIDGLLPLHEGLLKHPGLDQDVLIAQQPAGG